MNIDKSTQPGKIHFKGRKAQSNGTFLVYSSFAIGKLFFAENLGGNIVFQGLHIA